LTLKPFEILQLGYVCKSLEQGIDYFVDKQGAGPFYVMDIPAAAARYTYRGKALRPPTRNRVAFGYRGPLQFELIESDSPLFDDIRGDQAIAYHHCMQMTDNFESDIKRYADAGFATFGTAELTGVLIHYIDTVAILGHLTEVFNYQRAIDETNGAMFKLFDKMCATSIGWNGEKRMRLVADLV
jgi:hypothetical protein